jgi:transcriptional regulator of heat shock response
MMNSRAGQILEATIQEFIDTGSPVSSGWLYKRYNFGIKPAMIRLELDALEEDGYLEQPHHSAGRVPTDSGYAFYAEKVLALDFHREMKNAFANLLERRAWPDLLQELSSQLGLLGVVVDSVNDAIYKTGLEELVNRLDLDDHDEIRSVIRDFEAVDERLPGAAEKMGIGPHVFIGKSSPVTKCGNLSVIGGNYKVGNATVSIFAIGPRRMDYKKTIRIFKNF